MTIDGTKKAGDWGKIVPSNLANVHITQTSASANDGKGAHVTTNVPGEQIKIHDRYDEHGNNLGTNFAKR